jgi:hypothetical protein
LADDTLKRAYPEGVVKRNWDGDGRASLFELHDAMAAALARCDKPMPLKNLADFGGTLSLPNGHLNLGYEDFAMQPARDLGRCSGLEEKLKRFDEIGSGFFHR